MFKIIVNSLFQLSPITGLVAQTGIISIHGHSGSLNSSWEIIDIDEEEKGTQAGALWDTNFYILNVRINTINPTKLLTVGKVKTETRRVLGVRCRKVQAFYREYCDQLYQMLFSGL